MTMKVRMKVGRGVFSAKDGRSKWIDAGSVVETAVHVGMYLIRSGEADEVRDESGGVIAKRVAGAAANKSMSA